MQLIVGLKGTGKTKALIEQVNKASKETNGVVICVEYGRKLTFDIQYHARLVDVEEYSIDTAEKLYGFICGLLAGNYDITDLFIDNTLKMCGDAAAMEDLILKVEALTAKNNINCVITASVDPASLSEKLASFVG